MIGLVQRWCCLLIIQRNIVIINFGLKPSTAGRLIKKVVEQSQECENAKAAAADMVQLRLTLKKSRNVNNTNSS